MRPKQWQWQSKSFLPNLSATMINVLNSTAACLPACPQSRVVKILFLGPRLSNRLIERKSDYYFKFARKILTLACLYACWLVIAFHIRVRRRCNVLFLRMSQHQQLDLRGENRSPIVFESPKTNSRCELLFDDQLRNVLLCFRSRVWHEFGRSSHQNISWSVN